MKRKPKPVKGEITLKDLKRVKGGGFSVMTSFFKRWLFNGTPR